MSLDVKSSYKGEEAAPTWYANKALILVASSIIIVAVTASIIAIVIYSSTFDGSLSQNHERWGTFGDFFGGVLNPLFSFLALSALLFTLYQQSRQLELSRLELEETKKEIARSANSQEKASKAQHKTSVAQEKQARAMAYSARISAATKLLEVYKTRLNEAPIDFSASDYQFTRQQIEEMETELERLHLKLKTIR